MNDTHYTIRARERAELKVKGSRFIASVAPITTKDDALAFIDDLRKEFFDATHNCFAYRLGKNGLQFRTADDGEPNGTAGKPILFSIQKYDVSDIVLVVTRFFGGTKLGVGGLARAYAESAELVLSLCEKIPVYETRLVRVFCSYEDVALIKRLLVEYSTSYEEEYSDSVLFSAQILSSKVQEFRNFVQTVTNARAGTQIFD